MASIRLTNPFKDAIRANLKKAIADKHPEVQAIYDEFALSIHYEFHGQYEDVLRNLPEGTYATITTFSIYIADSPDGIYQYEGVKFPRAVKCFVYGTSPRINPQDYPSIYALYLRWKALNKELTDKQKLAVNTFNRIARGCNTLRQLQDAWPEVVAYLPPTCEAAKPLSLPMDANAVKTLNALLGR